jgi:hypothetical protein
MKKGHKDYLSNWILVDLIYLRFHRKRKVSQAYIYIYIYIINNMNSLPFSTKERQKKNT